MGPQVAPRRDAEQAWLRSWQAPLILSEGNTRVREDTGPMGEGNMNKG